MGMGPAAAGHQHLCRRTAEWHARTRSATTAVMSCVGRLPAIGSPAGESAAAVALFSAHGRSTPAQHRNRQVVTRDDRSRRESGAHPNQRPRAAAIHHPTQRPPSYRRQAAADLPRSKGHVPADCRCHRRLSDARSRLTGTTSLAATRWSTSLIKSSVSAASACEATSHCWRGARPMTSSFCS